MGGIVRPAAGEIEAAGALAALYEELGGAVVYAGKPHVPVYEAALAAAEALEPVGDVADRRPRRDAELLGVDAARHQQGRDPEARTR
jgi:ribonucleotide monophosphatase NagD (HAD superfamily)